MSSVPSERHGPLHSVRMSGDQATLDAVAAAAHPECLMCSAANPLGLKLKFEEKDIQLSVPALPANVVVSDTAGKQTQVAAAIATRRRRPDQPPPGEEPAAE